MQASLIDFDDLPAPPAADAAEGNPTATGTHQLQQEDHSSAAGAAAATVDEFNLWGSTANVGQLTAAVATGSDPFQDLISPGYGQQQDSQASQQSAPTQQQEQQVTVMQEHGLQETPSHEQQQHDQQPMKSQSSQAGCLASAQQQPDKHARQQHGHLQCTASSDVDPSLLPVCERVACLGQLLQQHGAAQGEANASIR
jgi:hypothetical protein